MRTYPRFGFRSGGTSECTLVPVFVPGEHPPKPPFWKTTLFKSGESNRPLTPTHAKKYRGTPPISMAILLQMYALPVSESSVYATNLYHDTPPICIAILLRKY